MWNAINLERLEKWNNSRTIHFKLQKQPSRGVLRKRCSENMQQIFKKTPFPRITSGRLLLKLETSYNLFTSWRIFIDRKCTAALGSKQHYFTPKHLQHFKQTLNFVSLTEFCKSFVFIYKRIFWVGCPLYFSQFDMKFFLSWESVSAEDLLNLNCII